MWGPARGCRWGMCGWGGAPRRRAEGTHIPDSDAQLCVMHAVCDAVLCVRAALFLQCLGQGRGTRESYWLTHPPRPPAVCQLCV